MFILFVVLLVQDVLVVQLFEVQGFCIIQIIIIEVLCDEVLEVVIGEVFYWWDYIWFGNLAELVIELCVGGYFYECFELGGVDGMIYVDIIFVDVLLILCMDGLLGLIE